MWGKYFPQAEAIVGCDINQKCAALTYEDPRMHVVVGDINSADTRNVIAARVPHLDIVIDDGSHISRDIIATFRHFYPMLKSGGVYLVEDLHCSYWSAFQGGLWRKDSPIEFFKLLADIVNRQSWGVEMEPADRIPLTRGDRRSRITVSDYLSIEGVHFYNSLCVITKGFTEKNSVGKRMVVGKEAPVCDLLPLSGTPLPVPGQPKNAKRLKNR